MTVTFIGDADVLDWLRSAAEDPAVEFWKFTIETAIDDIERYRADLKRIAELEAALREIADHPAGGVGCNPQSFVGIARKALSV